MEREKKAKVVKLTLDEAIQVELIRLRNMIEDHGKIANVLSKEYYRVLSEDLVRRGYRGSTLVSDGMLPDGTVELRPKNELIKKVSK